MTRGHDFEKKRTCKIKQCSPVSNSAWCDLSNKGDILKLHDMCLSPRGKCQNQVTFTKKQ